MMVRACILLILSLFFLFTQNALGQRCVVSGYPLFKILQELWPEENCYLLQPQRGEFHFAEPTPKDLEVIKRAELVFIVGTEPWAKKMYRLTSKDKIIGLSKPEERIPNPHLWFDFTRIESALIDFVHHASVKKSPHYEKIKRRLNLFEEDLNLLKEQYRALKNCPVKEYYILGHRVFDYLFKDAGIKEIPLIKGHHHGEVTPRNIQELLLKAKRGGARVVLLGDRELIRYKALLEKEGLEVREVWTGDYNKEGSFIKLMQENLSVFKYTLRCP